MEEEVGYTQQGKAYCSNTVFSPTQKSPFLEEDVGDQGSDTDDEVLYSKHSKVRPNW